MKLQKMIGSLTQVEMIALAVFVLYIVFPIENPQFISNMVDTPLGMVGVLAVTLYLFFNANPLVAILYVFVAYELLRRSSKQTGKAAIQEHTPSQQKKDKKMEKMNPGSDKQTNIDRLKAIATADIALIIFAVVGIMTLYTVGMTTDAKFTSFSLMLSDLPIAGVWAKSSLFKYDIASSLKI